jgi:hypothetical protein
MAEIQTNISSNNETDDVEESFEIIRREEIKEGELYVLNSQHKAIDEQEQRIRHNTHVLNDLQAGDLIEFKRNLYSHWAVYIGRNKVIHLYGMNENKTFTVSGVNLADSAIGQRAEVIMSNFWDIVNDSFVYRNNSFDQEMAPLPNEKILINAYDLVGTTTYSLLSYNCEHFAKHCRYGLPISDQAHQFLRFGNMVTKQLRHLHSNCLKLLNDLDFNKTA